jgi:hypothetical protein
MKFTQLALALALFTACAPSFAASTILQTKDGTKSLDNIRESQSGTITVEGRTSSLTTVGAGIRTATLGIHAYEAELLVNDKAKYCDGSAKGLQALPNLTALALRINVLFSFGKDKLIEAFNTAFDSNGVDPSNPDLQKFLTAIQNGPDAPRGDEIVFTGERLSDGTEVVTYENGGKAVTIHGATGFVAGVFSPWLGITEDGGLKNLDKALQSCQL